MPTEASLPMRTKTVVLLVLMLIVAAVTPGATAGAGERVFAQQGDEADTGDPTGAEEEAEGQEGQGGDGEGAGEPEAETGAGEGEQEEAAEEEGPLWTYQMARILLVLLVLMLLGIGGAYWNFVAKRQRQGI
jgi:hypothetical protein